MNSSEIFKLAIYRTTEFEGGYSNHTNDRGGKTKYGITEATWLNYWKKKNQVPPSRIESITQQQAKEIYFSEYWTAPGVDRVADVAPDLAVHLFDACVNHGSVAAVKMLQKACNFLGASLTVDGKIGAKTLAEVHSLAIRYGLALVNSFRFQRAKYYEAIVAKDSTQRAFLKGWMKRC
jgi:lysozyme family protein